MGWSGWLWIVLRLLERLSILFDSLFFFIGINRSALVFPAVRIFFGMIGGLDRLVHPKINLPQATVSVLYFISPSVRIIPKKGGVHAEIWTQLGDASGRGDSPPARAPRETVAALGKGRDGDVG
jgi:hypothetical protein